MRNPLLVLFGAAFYCSLSAVPADAQFWQDSYFHSRHHHPHHHKLKHHGQHHAKKARHHKRRAPPPPPIVVAHVDISSQSMSVDVNGWSYAHWPVSTARAGYSTPQGKFRVQRLARVYYSKKYDNSPMPYSVFFLGGNAVHGTYHIRQLGRPASHGCVRLAPDDAAAFYELVEKYGAKRSQIIVTD